MIEVYKSLDNIAIITLAPEIDGASSVIEQLVKKGIIVSLGHSTANLEQGEKAVQHGASLITHLFNAMLPVRLDAPLSKKINMMLILHAPFSSTIGIPVLWAFSPQTPYRPEKPSTLVLFLTVFTRIPLPCVSHTGPIPKVCTKLKEKPKLEIIN